MKEVKTMTRIEHCARVKATSFYTSSTLVTLFNDLNYTVGRNVKVFQVGKGCIAKFETYELAWRYAWRLVTNVKTLSRLDLMRARVNDLHPIYTLHQS